MKTRTLEDLGTRLDRALAWRLRELAALRSAVKTSRGVAQDLQIRAGVALLYAHWEGFVKEAAHAYVSFVDGQRVRCGQIASCFVAAWLRGRLEQTRQSDKVRFGVDTVETLRASENDVVRLPNKGVVRTRANLTSDVLLDILTMLGLSYRPYELMAKRIDTVLVKSRNEVAHGEMALMRSVEFLSLEEDIRGLILHFRNQIENAAATNSFMRTMVASECLSDSNSRPASS